MGSPSGFGSHSGGRDKYTSTIESRSVSLLLTLKVDSALLLLLKESYETSLSEATECQVIMARNKGEVVTMVAAGLFAMSSVTAAGRLLDLQVEILAAKKEQLSGDSIEPFRPSLRRHACP